MQWTEKRENLKRLMQQNNIKGEHLVFGQSCHSVEEDARAVDAPPEDFIKSFWVVDQKGVVIVAIVKGNDRASTSRVAKALNSERPRIVNGLVGGVPPFGFDTVFLIDPKVMEKEVVYGGRWKREFFGEDLTTRVAESRQWPDIKGTKVKWRTCE